MNLSVVDLGKFEKIPFEWKIAFAGSIGLHIVLIVVVLLFTGITYNSSKLPEVIDVDLTWMPAPVVKHPGETQKKVKAVKKKTHKKVTKTVKKKTAIPLKKKKTKKIKKKVAKPNDIINDAIKRLKKDLDKSKPDPIAERMKQLEDEVRATDHTQLDSRSSSQLKGQSGEQNALIASYISYVSVAVQENWAFSKNLAGGTKDLQTTISFIVMPDGEIKGVRIEKRSGNSYMDSAASMAVIKASPVNPFPPGITRKNIPLIVNFKPQ